MIKLQNLHQATLNSFTQKNTTNVSTPIKNNKLERSPQFDTVNFTGNNEQAEKNISFIDVDSEDIYEIPAENIYDVEDDIIDVDNDADTKLIQMLDEDEEEQKRRQEDEDRITNDMIIYGAILPEIAATQNISGIEPCDFDDDIVLKSDIEDLDDSNFDRQEDDYFEPDNDINDYGF